MNNFLLVAHGLRVNIDNDFEKSHFTVPEGFNFITFHKPGYTLFNNLGYIIADQLADFSKNILDTFAKSTVERRIALKEIEDSMVKNYLFKELDKINPDEDVDEDLFGFTINKYSDYLINYIFDADIPSTIDLSNSKNLVISEIDNIKKKLNFQIRVYPESSKAPLMNISFNGGNDNFNGLFEINNLPENLFNKSKDFEVLNILGYSLIKDDFIRSDGKAFSLDESLIEIFNRHNKNGNIFIFSCGDYNKFPKNNSLLRQESNRLQGIVKKYRINYN